MDIKEDAIKEAKRLATIKLSGNREKDEQIKKEFVKLFRKCNLTWQQIKEV